MNTQSDPHSSAHAGSSEQMPWKAVEPVVHLLAGALDARPFRSARRGQGYPSS